MKRLLSQIAPQRSSQYSQLASKLAVHELTLSPLGEKISASTNVNIGGQEFVLSEIRDELDINDLYALGYLAMTSAHYDYFEEIQDQPGPFLRPIDTGFTPALPREMVAARRYRGKTNELLTHFMCNVARYSSGFAKRPWNELRVFDPLAGGGTTLFTALMLGAEAAGVEHGAQDVASTAAFVRQFCREERIPYQERSERLRKLGKRWTFTLGNGAARRCVLAQGETEKSTELLAGFKPHLIVTDLPYGIQHQGQLAALLEVALPVWLKLLPHGGCAVFAWDATRFPRDEMVQLVEDTAHTRVLNQYPYSELSHRVDRVIKLRDLLVVQPLH